MNVYELEDSGGFVKVARCSSAAELESKLHVLLTEAVTAERNAFFVAVPDAKGVSLYGGTNDTAQDEEGESPSYFLRWIKPVLFSRELTIDDIYNAEMIDTQNWAVGEEAR